MEPELYCSYKPHGSVKSNRYKLHIVGIVHVCALLVEVETTSKIDNIAKKNDWNLDIPLFPESRTRSPLSPAMRHVMNCCRSIKASVLTEVNNSSMITECDHRNTL